MLRAIISAHVNRSWGVKLVNSTWIRQLKYKPIETDNKITIGHKMTQALEKKRQKYLLKKMNDGKYAPNKRLLIAAYNPHFHHYTNQVYRDFSERNLASYGWKNRRSRGKYFTINPIGSHPSLIDATKTRTNNDKLIELENMGLNECLIARVKSEFNIIRLIFEFFFDLNMQLNKFNVCFKGPLIYSI